MSTHPLTLEEVVTWLQSLGDSHAPSGVTLAEVRQNDKHLPSAAADFDSAKAIGRISVWVNGCVDFEVLRTADGKNVFFGHEEVTGISAPSLESAFADFIRYMVDPEERIGGDV